MDKVCLASSSHLLRFLLIRIMEEITGFGISKRLSERVVDYLFYFVSCEVLGKLPSGYLVDVHVPLITTPIYPANSLLIRLRFNLWRLKG
jgi:hypothetical protein